MYNSLDKKTRIIFPPIDPRLKKSLKLLYSRMKSSKDEEKRKNILNTNSRRCNRCGEYYDTTETELHKYYPDSRRKYRLCKTCVEHFEVFRLLRKQNVSNRDLEESVCRY